MSSSNKRAEKRVQEIIHLKEIFESEKGKNVLYDLCRRFHYFESSYKGDVNDTIFREGERNVINFIMQQTELNPAHLLDEFRKRLKEEREYEN